MTDKKKILAFVLNKDPDFNFSTAKIGEFLGVSQSTAWSAVKEVSVQRKIQNLESEIKEIKQSLPEDYRNHEMLKEPIKGPIPKEVMWKIEK